MGDKATPRILKYTKVKSGQITNYRTDKFSAYLLKEIEGQK